MSIIEEYLAVPSGILFECIVYFVNAMKSRGKSGRFNYSRAFRYAPACHRIFTIYKPIKAFDLYYIAFDFSSRSEFQNWRLERLNLGMWRQNLVNSRHFEFLIKHFKFGAIFEFGAFFLIRCHFRIWRYFRIWRICEFGAKKLNLSFKRCKFCI